MGMQINSGTDSGFRLVTVDPRGHVEHRYLTMQQLARLRIVPAAAPKDADRATEAKTDVDSELRVVMVPSPSSETAAIPTDDAVLAPEVGSGVSGGAGAGSLSADAGARAAALHRFLGACPPDRLPSLGGSGFDTADVKLKAKV